jgi:hypothetical protein
MLFLARSRISSPSTTRTHHRPRACAGAAAALVLMAAATAAAEVELPRQNPAATVSQQVGLTDIAVEYASPAVKGRKIWGQVVPFDRTWSISPNQPTKIRFSKDVQIGERTVAAGTYSLSAVPTKGDWTIVLAKLAAPGVPGGDERVDSDPVRLKVHPKASAFRERLTFLFSDFSEEKTTLDLEWDKLRVSVPIGVNTTRQVLSGISELDSAWRSYANAARYMLETKKDYDAGLKYADQSLALKEDWYTYWIKGSLHAAKGDWKAAREAGEKAYQLGQKSGDSFVLEAELKKDISEWGRRAGEGNLSSR